MKPARSPRFQSLAERCSIIAISCGGLPSGILGAEHANSSDTRTTHDARRTGFFSLTQPRERLGEALPRMSKRVGLAAAFLFRGLLLLCCLLPRLRPRLLGGFLFLPGLRLGGRAGRPFPPHRRGGRGRRGGPQGHRPPDTRAKPTASPEGHIATHAAL